MSETDYITEMNDADRAKVIKQYALFLFPKGTLTGSTVPTSKKWTPPAGKEPIGYSTEDGAVLHPESGEETELKGHNGDVIVSESTGGYWTLQLAGVECRREVAAAYFGVQADSEGAIHVDDASNSAEWELVLAALDHKGRPMVLYVPSSSVGDRDDVSLKYTEMISMSLTFKMKRLPGKHMFSLFGFVEDAAKSAASSGPARSEEK